MVHAEISHGMGEEVKEPNISPMIGNAIPGR